MRIIYLDNNATTQVDQEVLESMLPYFREHYGNPSSAYSFGGRVAEEIAKAREQVATLLGAEPAEIVFTGSGTESDNTAIRSALLAYPDKKHIVTSAVEHPAVRSLCRHLTREGYRITEVPVNQGGELDMSRYEESLTPDTAVVSLMWANNETGVIFPVEQAAAMAHQKGLLFHTDAVQAVGKVPIRLRETPVDMLSLSAHKLHGPKGVGALYIKKGTRFRPWLIGGHQERNRRPGTENTAGIIGLGKACELAALRTEQENSRVKELRDRLEQELLRRIPAVSVNGAGSERLPNTTNIRFEGIEGESILLRLDDAGVCVSTGSACSSGSLEPSHVLLAMGIPPASAQGAIRFSLSVATTDEEIDVVVSRLPEIVGGLRNMSPVWREMQTNR